MKPFETYSTKHLAFLKKFKIFFEKAHLFSQKKTNFERFEKSYYSSRILRQICCNLVKKITFRNVNAIGKHRVKKTFQLRGRFSFHNLFINMAETTESQSLVSAQICPCIQAFPKTVKRMTAEFLITFKNRIKQ